MTLKHLEIYNFGPIREARMNLTRVNVFIGPQSVGKSCLLKIACHCAWAEKRLMVSRDVTFFQKDNYFFEQLLSFHKLQGYDTKPDLRIVYQTDFLTLEYKHSDQLFTCTFTRQEKAYKRAKLSYIPAERNVIATIPNWMELSYEDTNTRSFMADWTEARKEFAKKRLSLLSLGAEYYYDDQADRDMVKFKDMDSSLPMSNTSSGVQSVTPVMLYVHYLTQSVFKDTSMSIARARDNEKLMHRMYKELTAKAQQNDKDRDPSYEVKLNSEFLSFTSEEEKKSFLERYNHYTRYQHSDIFLEEPEENLFPETQAEVVYHLLESIFATERENTLFMATHSPYVLYALNNAILANIVRGNMPEEAFSTLDCGRALFPSKEISVWQLKNGVIESICQSESNTIQDKSGLIRQNYFDNVMKKVMADFNNMMSYRDYE